MNNNRGQVDFYRVQHNSDFFLLFVGFSPVFTDPIKRSMGGFAKFVVIFPDLSPLLLWWDFRKSSELFAFTFYHTQLDAQTKHYFIYSVFDLKEDSLGIFGESRLP
jgi:hypothetical protein